MATQAAQRIKTASDGELVGMASCQIVCFFECEDISQELSGIKDCTKQLRPSPAMTLDKRSSDETSHNGPQNASESISYLPDVHCQSANKRQDGQRAPSAPNFLPSVLSHMLPEDINHDCTANYDPRTCKLLPVQHLYLCSKYGQSHRSKCTQKVRGRQTETRRPDINITAVAQFFYWPWPCSQLDKVSRWPCWYPPRHIGPARQLSFRLESNAVDAAL